jgi:hypothetical protein
VGSSTASGALCIGGKSCSILEQAALLLQRAFEVMKEPTKQTKQVAEELRVDKGKGVMETEPTKKHSKPAAMIVGPESSKQGEVRGNNSKVHCH